MIFPVRAGAARRAAAPPRSGRPGRARARRPAQPQHGMVRGPQRGAEKGGEAGAKRPLRRLPARCACCACVRAGCIFMPRQS
ncbi:MAG: hypothetical protein DBY17_09345 [Oscillospiraceae bacterium]|nr:MAG: hypothetical protein DBY17_09345 [Oscillospiraceae bacterium]